MEPLFEGLTSSEIEYLQYLNKCGYFDGFEMFINLDTSSDYRVKKLQDGGYITLDEKSPDSVSCPVTITGKGIAALIDYEKYQNQIQPLNIEIEALNSIACSLQQQVYIAEQNVIDSVHELKFTKKLTIASLTVAVLAMLPELIRFIYAVLKTLL